MVVSSPEERMAYVGVGTYHAVLLVRMVQVNVAC